MKTICILFIIRDLEYSVPRCSAAAMQSNNVKSHDMVPVLIHTGRSRHTVFENTNKTTQARIRAACIVAPSGNP